MLKRLLFALALIGMFSPPAATAWLDGCQECYPVTVPDPDGSGPLETNVCLDLVDGGWVVCRRFTSGGGPSGCIVNLYCPIWPL